MNSCCYSTVTFISGNQQLRESLGLPSIRCLDDYKNAWKNGSGWQEAKSMKLIEDKKTYQLIESKLFGYITVDEMTINQGICWNPEGDIVGFKILIPLILILHLWKNI